MASLLESSKRGLLVLFASETGCAQDFAEEIGREARRIHVTAEILPLDSYNVTKLPIEQRIVIFVISTTGQGDMPSNATKFWRFLLRKHLPSNSLSRVQVALCGLGDSGYKEFNFAAKKLYRRLCQLSAQMIMEPAYGDDQSPMGPYQILDPWKDALITQLLTIFPLPEGVSRLEDQLPESRYIVTVCNKSELEKENKQITTKEEVESSSELSVGPFTQTNPFHGKILKNKRLTAEDWQQDVRHFSVKIDETMEFQPGDSLAILPCNPPNEVLSFLARVNISADTVITSITPRNPNIPDSGPKSIQHLEFPMSVIELFEKHLDIMGTPRRYFFKLLSYFATAEHERDRLSYFASTEAQDELRLYNDKEKRSVREVLEDFPSAFPPLEYLLDLIPPIQPRLFSIASSFKYCPNEAQLLVALVQFSTPLKRRRVGLCTNWMAGLTTNDTMRVWIREGSSRFHLPQDTKAPIIMIGPGTGLAPFRAFIQERVYLSQQGKSLGWSSLYTGCRYKLKDWYYGDEFNEYVKLECLSRYYVAFSRDTMDIDKRKTYVQHLMRDTSEEIWNVLNGGGYVFLSGSALQMPQSVKEELLVIIQNEGNMNIEEAERFFRTMEISGRYSSETWQ